MPSKSHGMSGTPIYAIWRGMMQRCYDKNHHAYLRYGGRGITVCDAWKNFEKFYADMGDKPAGMSLDRIDNMKSYFPENVAWVTAKKQANNRRNNILIEINGKTKTMQEWCDETGVKIATVWARINVYGYSVEKALTPGWRARNV